MATREGWPVQVLENPQIKAKEFSRWNKFRHGMLPSPFLRMNWFTLVGVDPEDIPWAEPAGNGDDAPHSGRASVMRVSWAAMAAAGGLPEAAKQVMLREWNGTVQMSNAAEPSLFRWEDDNNFTGAAFAESERGRVAPGVRSSTSLTIPKGVLLLEQIPPAKLRERYQGIILAA